ncbi:probable Dol-P-Man:Man(7)GlcNAc(2)-PP-Dol alpha-1,6-mannosyltransferase isoform X2 [Athalia rosae]|nr:probable Dol-P-Man:Man(7)GlcNAc(2)-PP-Dol alpha-1,6-mannosyltransferase isoform X2 [Athalia rosae]XP_048504971.1 probable Dol-P-Man:Man(7)GlcNAc(2)-PP-Dol alpha-1,6-mannosyltransferase isoform X2 [Athalia rosae]
MHDILYHGSNLTEYDHHDFPGVVPRTFLGPIFISGIVAPFAAAVDHLNMNKFCVQYIVRAALGLTVIATLRLYRQALQLIFGQQFMKWFVAITVTQYHFMYYLSRPLPNIMAMPLVLIALYGWLRQNPTIFICSSAAAIIIFRAELAMLLGLFLLHDLVNKKLTISRLLRIAIPAGIFLLGLTVIVDSIFWNRFVWPEGEVFYFNTILNKSNQWGTSPFLWYFYSALPRGLAFSYVLIPLGMLWDNRVRTLTIPGIFFVLLFSFLPHKELRFIIYVFPLLNVGAAAACHRIWENRAKSSWHGFLALAVLTHIFLNAIFSMFLLCVAGANYPGGSAIARLHRLERESFEPVHVHIDVLTAQTGVSRFTQTNKSWIYSKQENINVDSPEMLQFTHLLMEAKSKYSPNIKPYMKTHDILDSVDGFSHIVLNYNGMSPIKIKTKPMIFIMKRKPNTKYDPTKDRIKRDTNDGSTSIDDENVVLTSEIPGEDLDQMGMIFEDIEASLEAFGKPLEQTLNDPLVQENLDTYESINTMDSSIENANEINRETESMAKVYSDEEVNTEHDKLPLYAVPEIQLDDSLSIAEKILESQVDSSSIGAVDDKYDVSHDPTKSDSKAEQQKTGNVKKSVKKLIQKKMDEVKSKKEDIGNDELEVVLEKPNSPGKTDESQKTRRIVNKPLNREVLTNHKQNVIHVKESIRNIIAQFKEFEKDLATEDSVSFKKASDEEFLDQSVEDNHEIEERSLEENNVETDEYIINAQGSGRVKDARVSLKEIIDQFKELKNELSSDEDDRFDQISADYINRPISETLMLFSEALKDLVLRRKEKAAMLSLEKYKFPRKQISNEDDSLSGFTKDNLKPEVIRKSMSQMDEVPVIESPENRPPTVSVHKRPRETLMDDGKILTEADEIKFEKHTKKEQQDESRALNV